MLVLSILLVIVGIFTIAFGVLQNTILITFFDQNAQLERMLSDIDFSPAWIFDGPGTTVMIVGSLMVVVGIILLLIRRRNNRMLRQVNTNIRNTNKRRKQKGKKAP